MSAKDVKCYTVDCQNRVPRGEWPAFADRRFGIFCRECLSHKKASK